MAGCARREIVRKGQPGIYHVWSRCVRQAYLMGKDPHTGKPLDHRRQWVKDRLRLLVASFAIDVGFLGVMSNHLHLVLRAMPRLVKRMGKRELARRWLRVYPGKRVLDDQWIEPTEEQIKALAKDKKKIEVIRGRLSDVSWFMAALSEYIARRSNAEDGCTGRFWEGRFSCREIKTERALLICGIYVDLNQIRAGEVLTPEASMNCSVGLRIQSSLYARNQRRPKEKALEDDRWLAPLTLAPGQLGDMPCSDGVRASDKGLLDLTLDEYLALLDFSGRRAQEGKRGSIPSHLAPILERLRIQGDDFVRAVAKFPQWFRRFAGNVEHFEERAREIGRTCLHGIAPARQIFP